MCEFNPLYCDCHEWAPKVKPMAKGDLDSLRKMREAEYDREMRSRKNGESTRTTKERSSEPRSVERPPDDPAQGTGTVEGRANDTGAASASAAGADSRPAPRRGRPPKRSTGA